MAKLMETTNMEKTAGEPAGIKKAMEKQCLFGEGLNGFGPNISKRTGSRLVEKGLVSIDNLKFDPEMFGYLMNKYKEYGIDINGCHLRDLIDHILDDASYMGRSAKITREALDAAWTNYFVHE